MEDTHVSVGSLDGFSTASFFAVFDGHGGTLAAEYSANEILTTLMSLPGFGPDLSCEEIGRLLSTTFLSLDTSLRNHPHMSRGDDHSGCTAISGFITPTHIIVSNTGDSRSVLGKNGATVPMSFDHKPYDDKERERIERAGGVVRNKRVNGDLAVSRALGDFVYKGRGDLPAVEQQVSPEPDIKIEQRDGTEEFLVIACDGIWDVMSNDDVCQYIRALLDAGERDMGLIAEELLDYCLLLGSRDNMSAVIVALPGIQYGTGDGVEGIRARRAAEAAEAEAKAAAALQQNASQQPPAPTTT